MKLTNRDIEMLATLNRYRLLSQSQLQRLHFPSKNTAQVRLHLLWQHHYIKRIVDPGSVTTELLYTLDRKGSEFLQLHLGLTKNQIRFYRGKTLNPLALAHTLEIANIRIAAEKSAHHNGLLIRVWDDDQDTKANPDRIQLDQRLVPIVPDAYFAVVAQTIVYHFFLEYDTGTENMVTLERKMRAFQAYFQSGKSELRYKTNKIRVLFVSRAEGKRFDNMKALAGKLALGFHFCFTCLTKLDADFFTGPIWLGPSGNDPKALIPKNT